MAGAMGAGATAGAVGGVIHDSQGVAWPAALEDEGFGELLKGGERVPGLLFSGGVAGLVGACGIR
jgi:hypothetical protein